MQLQSPSEMTTTASPAAVGRGALLELRLAPGRVLTVLAVIIGLLTALNAARLIWVHVLRHGTFFGLIDLFDVDSEGTIPSMYSALALLFAGLLLAMIARSEQLRRTGGARWWAGLALIFCFLAADEFCEIHELFNTPTQQRLKTGGIFFFAWTIPALMALLPLSVIYARFLFRLPSRIRTLALLSAAIFLSGAIGCELVGSYLYARNDYSTPAYHIEVAVEEFLEMSGVAIWIYALLLYLNRLASPPPVLTVSFGDRTAN